MAETLDQLVKDGVTTVRLSYPDLHGIARGKEFPASFFDHLLEDGAGYCEAIMTVDLRHNVVSGFEHGFQDIIARPDPATLRRVPWDPEVAVCIADLERMDGSPYGVDSRGVLKRAIAGFAERGLTPILGPELEFYLCQPDAAAPNGYRRYVDNDSHVYTVGAVADPRGILRKMLHAFADMRLGAYAANHEYGRAQYEINLRHSDALDAADRAFLFKDAVKEMAAMRRPSGDVRRQAVERRRGVGVPPAHLARRRIGSQPVERGRPRGPLERGASRRSPACSSTADR